MSSPQRGRWLYSIAKCGDSANLRGRHDPNSTASRPDFSPWPPTFRKRVKKVTENAVAVSDDDLCDENLGPMPAYLEAAVKRLKAERDAAVSRAERAVRLLGQAYASGWSDAIAAYRAPGWAEREEAWRKYRKEVDGLLTAAKDAADA